MKTQATAAHRKSSRTSLLRPSAFSHSPPRMEVGPTPAMTCASTQQGWTGQQAAHVKRSCRPTCELPGCPWNMPNTLCEHKPKKLHGPQGLTSSSAASAARPRLKSMAVVSASMASAAAGRARQTAAAVGSQHSAHGVARHMPKGAFRRLRSNCAPHAVAAPTAPV